jgi:hypothetical protein
MDLNDDSWTCSVCRTDQSVSWDDELEQDVGLPAFVGVSDSGAKVAICDACTPGADPHQLMAFADRL